MRRPSRPPTVPPDHKLPRYTLPQLRSETQPARGRYDIEKNEGLPGRSRRAYRRYRQAAFRQDHGCARRGGSLLLVIKEGVSRDYIGEDICVR